MWLMFSCKCVVHCGTNANEATLSMSVMPNDIICGNPLTIYVGYTKVKFV